jgi:ribonuclease E
MIRFACTILIGTIILIGGAIAADVSRIDMSYVNGATETRISVDGPVRFMHQTEVPKNGKPYRVIVDVLATEHKLGAKEFFNLPPCPVSAIRTSQYAVTPEKIVRVVFDMKGSPIYQIRSEQGAVVVTFPDKDGKPFAAWSSAPAASRKPATKKTEVASAPAPDKKSSDATTVAQQNQKIDSDRMASLSGAEQEPAPAKSTAKPKVAKSDVIDTDLEPKLTADQPAISLPADKPSQAKAQSKASAPAKKKQPIVAKPASQPKVETKAQANKGTTPSVKAQPEASKPAATVASKPVQSTPKVSTPAVKAQPKAQVAKTETRKAEPKKADTKKAQPRKTTVASVDKKKSDEASSSSTSRFRRNPAKIKGTMVAEFPKRLVIKYKPQINRDPFQTLIVESESHDSPIHERIPNVEGLRLVGVIESDAEANRALLEDKGGYSYILKSGDKVKRGYVLRVEVDRVYFQIFEYGWSRTVALALEDY